MPRTARASAANYCYHVLNRGNGRQEVFHKADDYAAFLKLMVDADQRADCAPMRILAYCLMPKHFHLVLWPREDGDLSRWMQWLLTSHVRRYHRHYGTSGHVWQGRFKAFPIQRDDHLLTVMRYVERNPLRSKTLRVRRAERWPWSSITAADACRINLERPTLCPGPVPRGADWLEWVNAPLTDAELAALRQSVARGRPFGDAPWQKRTANELGLEATLNPRGRPRKSDKK
jgi:putative transposase